MSGLLVMDRQSSESPQLMEYIKELRLEVASLRQELAEVHQENLELRQKLAEVQRENLILRNDAGKWKSLYKRTKKKVEKLQAENEQLRGEIRQLQGRLYGQKSEQASSKRDRSNHLPGEELDDDGQPPVSKPRGQQQGKPGPQRRDYSHLPVEEKWITLSPEEARCPRCGRPYTLCGSEDSEQVEVNVRAYRRRFHRQRFQCTCDCDGPRTLVAPPPPKLIPKGLLGTSVWVEFLLGKFYSHEPIERQLTAWRLRGLDLSAGTVTGGLRRIEPLFEPLYNELLAHSPQARFAQADETRWMMFIEHEGKVGHRWWLWVFLTEDCVVFRLDPSRSHDVPEAHFAAGVAACDGACMIVMVDRYSAYKAMDLVKRGIVILVFCWAHVRRDFIEVGKGWEELRPWALAWLRRIRALYRYQQQRLEHKPGSEEFRIADTALRETLTQMESQAATELADPKLREPCRKKLVSLQEHWSGLTRFADDLRIPMDNNGSERENRGPAMGRKNYYGSGALWAGRLATMLFSLFATVQRCGLNPRLWLTSYLESCAAAGGKVPQDTSPFIPWQMTAERRQSLSLAAPDTS